MKKTLIIIFAICLSLILCACGNKTNEANSNDIHNDIGTLDVGELPQLYFYSLNEYKDFLSSNKLQATFIEYEKIKALGEFKGLVFLSDAYQNDYSSYMYTLVDPEGYEIALYVDENSKDDTISTTTSISMVNTSDMRVLAEKSSGTYVSDNFTYKYVSGELLSISWIDQNVKYTLCGASMLSNYPPCSSTFLGMVLNADNAADAFHDVFNEAKK